MLAELDPANLWVAAANQVLAATAAAAVVPPPPPPPPPKKAAAPASAAEPKAPTKILVRDKKTGKLKGKIHDLVKRDKRRLLGPNLDLDQRKVQVDIYQKQRAGETGPSTSRPSAGASASTASCATSRWSPWRPARGSSTSASSSSRSSHRPGPALRRDPRLCRQRRPPREPADPRHLQRQHSGRLEPSARARTDHAGRDSHYGPPVPARVVTVADHWPSLKS